LCNSSWAHYDAYLDVVLVGIAYIAATISSPYQPVVFMKYRLFRATDNHVREQGTFQYSSSRGDLHPDPKFDYQHYSQFSKDPSIAIAGLSEGLSEGSSAISNGSN
jgi:hypothetical protein